MGGWFDGFVGWGARGKERTQGQLGAEERRERECGKAGGVNVHVQDAGTIGSGPGTPLGEGAGI